MYRHLLNMQIFVLNFLGGVFDRIRCPRDKMVSAKEALSKLRPMSMQMCANLMKSNGFKWHRDPLKGKFDYVSEPWFTLYSKCGDCDDFAAFWEYMCKDYPSVRFDIRAEGDGHAMICFRMEGQYYVASNLVIELKLDPNDEDIKDRYGDITDFESAVLAASKILYGDSLKSVRILSSGGYIKKIINVDGEK